MLVFENLTWSALVGWMSDHQVGASLPHLNTPTSSCPPLLRCDLECNLLLDRLASRALRERLFQMPAQH